LTASNTYTGNSTITSGTLQLGDGVASNGSVVGNIVNNSALVFANPAAQVFSGLISGSGSFVKIGAGTLSITAQQSYTGPTVIGAGIVKLPSAANVAGFGLDTSGGGSNSTWTINTNNVGTTAITNNVLTLTDGNQSEARSAFANTPVSINQPFTVNFTYHDLGGGGADGATFILQNDSRGLSALGGVGGGWGYTNANGGTAIAPSVGVGFDIYNQNLNLLQNGSSVLSTNDPGGIDPSSGDPIQVTLAYDGSGNLQISLLDLANGNAYSTIDPLGASLASLLGGNTAYMGFTGASGDITATQTISRFNSSLTYAAVNILPAGTALTVAANSTVDLGGANQTVGSLSGAGLVTNSATSAVMFTVGDATSTTFSGSLNDAGGGGIALAKQGAGTLVLSGSGQLQLAANINAGVLEIDGSYSLPIVNVENAAQIAGSGTLTLSSSTDGLYYQSSGTSNFAGSIDGSGGLEVDSGALVLSGTSHFSGGTLVENNGLLILTDNQAIPEGSSLTVGDAGAFAPLVSAASTGSPEISPVPEPGTLALAACGAALLAMRRGRRRDWERGRI
jgi:autotransporter-associated beta strand protein